MNQAEHWLQLAGACDRVAEIYEAMAQDRRDEAKRFRQLAWEISRPSDEPSSGVTTNGGKVA